MNSIPTLSPAAPLGPAFDITRRTEAGRKHLHHGRLDKAASVLSQVLAVQPDYAPARKLLGFAAAERRDWRLAAACWRAVLAAEPAAAERAEAQHAVSAALLELGELKEAASQLDALRATAHGRTLYRNSALRMRAEAASKQQDWPAAEALWREFAAIALEDNPPLPPELAIDAADEAAPLAGIAALKNYLRKKKNQLAERMRRQAPPLDAVLTAWHEHSRCCFQLDRIKDAIASLDEMLALAPGHLPAWHERSRYCFQLGRFKDAIASLDEMLALEPGHLPAWHDRSRYCFQLGRFNEADQAAEKAAALDAGYLPARLIRAWVAVSREDWPAAEARWRDVLSCMQQQPQALAREMPQASAEGGADGAASAADLAGKTGAAGNASAADAASAASAAGAASTEGASGISPAQIWYEHSRSCCNLGRIEEAAASLEKALELHPDPPEWWLEHSRNCYDLGRLEDAAASAEQALSLRPDSPPGWWLEHSRSSYHLGRLEDAEQSAEKALQLDRRCLPALQILAWVAAAREDWPLAEARTREVLALELKKKQRQPSSDMEQAMRGLTLALIEQGRFKEADAQLKRLERQGPRSDGARIALEMRVTMAERQLDEQGAEAARRAIAARFPEAAADSPAWLRLPLSLSGGKGAGGGNGAEGAKAIASLRRAANAGDEQAAHLIMFDMEPRLPRGEYLQLVRETAEAMPDAPDMQSRFIRLLADSLQSDGQLRELQERSHLFRERFPHHPQGWRLDAIAAIAANDAPAVAAIAEAAAEEMGDHAALDELRLWLAAAAGDFAAADRFSARLRSRRYVFDEDHRELALQPVNRAPRSPMKERILLFACFRNEREFAPWFLNYYRGLGVDRFFIVDSLSDDGTADYLCKQKDVTVFRSADSYIRAGSGIRWINELIRRYGAGNWCVHADADEQLVLPVSCEADDSPSSPLRRLVDDMASRGEEALPAFMLDTYPDIRAAKDMAELRDAVQGDYCPDAGPLSLSPLVDPDIYFSGKSTCCFFRGRGGARERLFGSNEILEKAPVIRGGASFYQNASHQISYGKVSRRSGVLLHHKLLREMLEMRADETSISTWRIDNRGAVCRARHARYRSSGFLDADGGVPRGPNALRYENPAQLQRLGLLGDASALRGGGGVTRHTISAPTRYAPAADRPLAARWLPRNAAAPERTPGTEAINSHE